MIISKDCSHWIISLLCLITIFTFARCEYDIYDDVVNNPYRELRIPPWSSMSQIKQRYKELVKAYHPDKTKTRNSHDKFLAIQQAYEKIKNRRKSSEREDNAYDYDDFESEEVNSFFDAVSDTLKIITACGISMSGVYFISWICYKFYALIYTPLFTMITSFVICDRLFPHFFKNFENQTFYSFVFGILLIFSQRILKFLFQRIYGKKVVDSTKEKKDN
jgi:curved DNA-binding protein CbpA